MRKQGFQDPTEASTATKENKHRVWGMQHRCSRDVLTVMKTLGQTRLVMDKVKGTQVPVLRWAGGW